MMQISRDDAETFLFLEARLLDENALYDWLDLTTDDFVYWIPVNDDSADPSRHLSIIYENKHQCATRVFRVLESGLNHPQDPPSRTARLVSNVEAFPGPADDEATARCNLLLCEHRLHGQRGEALTSHQYLARCEYRLRRQQSDWRMAYKKVSFVNLDGPLEGMTYFV